jgi:glutamyl/glutaminyl-tRNA synthetase
MSASKMDREPAVEKGPEKTGVRDETAALLLRGVERLAEIQKQYLDIAVQHNAEVVEVAQKAAEKLPGKPFFPMLDLTNSAVNRTAEIQKTTIDFFVEQTRVWTNLFKDRNSTAKESAESTANVAKQALEQSFAVQKKTMENTAAQAKAWVDATRREFGLTGAQAEALTDTFQRGVESVVEAQKEVLDLVTH